MPDVDCTICYDQGVIHIIGLAPQNKHEPTPGVRPDLTPKQRARMADWSPKRYPCTSDRPCGVCPGCTEPHEDHA